MEYVAVVTILALLEYMYFSILVGQARVRYDIKAPAVSGHEVFERYFRIQQNTIEQLIVFLPALWVFAYYVHAPTAAVLGLVFIAGRFIYQLGYSKDPKKRGPGFGIGFLAIIVLTLGGLIGALVSVFSGS